MRRKLNPDHVEIIIQSTEFNRSDDFLSHFDFIDSTRYEDFSIIPEPIYFPDVFGMPTPKPTDENGHYIYIYSTGNFMGDPNSWLLIANGHLERGNRLETWLTGFETEIHIAKHFHFRDNEIEYAKQFHKQTLNNKQFVTFYMGPLNGNTIAGHNRNSLWTIREWQVILENLLYINPELVFVIVGAKQDWQYANIFMGSLTSHHRNKCVNFCGNTTIGECFALIKRSQFLLSYQCGVGIFSAYLGHPCAVWYRPYGDSMSSDFMGTYVEAFSHCWAPMEYINKTYFPLLYKRESPEDIVKIIHKFV